MCFICDLQSASSATVSTSTTTAREEPVWSARRAFVLAGAAAATAAALPAAAQVDVGRSSALRKLVPADELESAARQQYAQMMSEASGRQALLPASHPQVQRLRGIARRIIPHAPPWNARATQWQWEVNLIESPQVNAFCMPGGKIAFYTGILDKLKLNDDEAAMIMGHEMAHALREHARARVAKSSATNIGLRLGAQLLGLGELGNMAAGLGTQLLTLRFSREDESEADLVGLELAARAAFKPQASVSLWQKMTATTGGAGAGFLSTHPSGPNRIRDLQANVPKVQGLFEQARRG
ncbi:MAG: M48 family metallopeptidase [Hydrogenophaga sp.]|uniref:M48 family metallopeptidase n=1 Tax=Hydrogenophaga sp. TaxID=1904254 RepID=UPI001BBA6DC7|nr:M48 family metallopeptidase [Hydrogenophaga sp.]MBS3910313.1 M48 family metallopeptidase [Hydrogenophaga sp.]MDO9148526.1 M48 family metallopeptidase [Hydrogenophaga sp.]MDO9605245.1 M48 family metallopeptidase [Hydrogenophaga sp.]MDP2163558.1 M48 family metallopeptidase [Hydrogenophaga sp.]MDP3474821.1 M48 family metallopeptidase [Hydrogenophaga sp.]